MLPLFQSLGDEVNKDGEPLRIAMQAFLRLQPALLSDHKY